MSQSEAVLSLTSSKLKGAIDNFSSDESKLKFFRENNFSARQKHLIETIISEANENKFIVRVQFSK